MVELYYCKECESIMYIKPLEGTTFKDVSFPSSVSNFSAFMSKKEKLPICCDKEMVKLEPHIIESLQEKHLPFVKINGRKVTIKVGSILHSMTEEHHIVYILLDTKKTRYEMYPYKQKEAPEIIFEIEEDDKPIAVYAVCNLHGLWKFDL